MQMGFASLFLKRFPFLYLFLHLAQPEVYADAMVTSSAQFAARGRPGNWAGHGISVTICMGTEKLVGTTK